MPTTTASKYQEEKLGLVIECKQHYEDVIQFAEEHGCRDQLNSMFARLAGMTSWPDLCFVHKDFAPHSFAFMIGDGKQRRQLMGGLIYSGPAQSLDGSAPTYTVSVEPPSNEHKWGIHT